MDRSFRCRKSDRAPRDGGFQRPALDAVADMSVVLDRAGHGTARVFGVGQSGVNDMRRRSQMMEHRFATKTSTTSH
jgi:hypothetical protein